MRSSASSRDNVNVVLRDMVVLLECLRHRREVQTLETSYFDDIVLQSPLLCLERYDEVDVFEKACDGVCLGAVRVRDVPKNIRGWETVALYREPQTHVARVESREVARSSVLSPVVVLVNFWQLFQLGPMIDR